MKNLTRINRLPVEGAHAPERARTPRRGLETGLGQPGYCEACSTWNPEGPDVCLGTIPGVSHACCGHGNSESAYVVLGGRPDESVWAFDTITLRGDAASRFFALLREGQFEHGHPHR